MLSGPYKFSVRRKWLAVSILADILDRLVGIILGTSGVLLSCGWCCRKCLSGRQVSRCVPFGCGQVCMLAIMECFRCAEILSQPPLRRSFVPAQDKHPVTNIPIFATTMLPALCRQILARAQQGLLRRVPRQCFQTSQPSCLECLLVTWQGDLSLFIWKYVIMKFRWGCLQ